MRKTFGWNDQKDCKDPAKVFKKFQASFQAPNIQCIYREKPFDLKQGDSKTTKQLDVDVTNVVLKCGHPRISWTATKSSFIPCCTIL